MINEEEDDDNTRILGSTGPVNSRSCGGFARFARKLASLKLFLDYNIQETKY